MVAIILITISCKEDEILEIEPITASDVTTDIDENPDDAAFVITINATSTVGAVTYSIASQSPSSAITIDGVTGEVSTDDESLFDYEVRQSITVIVQISDGTNIKNITLTININNSDDIADFLTSSKTTYQSAADGTWIPITALEYGILASSLYDVTKSATSDAEYNAMMIVTSGGSNFTLANNNGHTIPSGDYIFAFKFDAQTLANAGNKVYMTSDSINGTYTAIGDPLPSHTSGNKYFVVKGNDISTTNVGYLAMYYSNNIGRKNLVAANNYVYAYGDVTSLPLVGSDNTFLYQGLSTSVKQWD